MLFMLFSTKKMDSFYNSCYVSCVFSFISRTSIRKTSWNYKSCRILCNHNFTWAQLKRSFFITRKQHPPTFVRLGVGVWWLIMTLSQSELTSAPGWPIGSQHCVVSAGLWWLTVHQMWKCLSCLALGAAVRWFSAWAPSPAWASFIMSADLKWGSENCL